MSEHLGPEASTLNDTQLIPPEKVIDLSEANPQVTQLELPVVLAEAIPVKPPTWFKATEYGWKIATLGSKAFSSKKGIATLLALAPEAAAICALYYGPAAEIDNIPLQGTHITANVRPGHDSIDANLTVANLKIPQRKTFLGKPIGVELQGDISSVLNSSPDTDGIQPVDKLIAIIGQSDNEVSKVEAKVALHSEYIATLTAGIVVELEALGFIGRTLYLRCLAQRSASAQSEIIDFAKPIQRIGTVALTHVLTMGVAASGVLLSPFSNVHDQLVASPALNGTFLEGSQLTTPATSQVNSLLNQGIDVISNERQAYKRIDNNQALALKAALSNLAELHKKYTFVMEADDFQGVPGMLNTFAEASKQVGADLAVIDGDVGTGIAPYDQLLVKNFVDGVAGIPVAVAGGEHDSKSLLTYMKSLGIRVPDGTTVQTVAGLKVVLLPSLELSQLGIGGEPLATTPGLSHAKILEETIKNVSEQLAQEHVNVVIVHDYAEGDPIAATGLADSLFEGRSFSDHEIKIVGHNDSYTFKLKNSSTGGHGAGDGPEFTVIHNPARYSIVLYDKQTHKPAMVYTVTILPDSSVSIDPPTIISGSNELNLIAAPR